MDELTPRTVDAASPRSRLRRRLTIGLAVLAFAAVGFVLFKGLSDAALFFRNADEAVADRDDLGDSRFRLQGVVVDGTVRADGDLVLFAVAFNDVVVDVAHRGPAPELFQPDVPVVLEGRFADGAAPQGITYVDTGGTGGDGYHFASDRMLVKHDNEYVAENEGRLRDAERGGTADR